MFTVKGGKFKFSPQGRDLAPFFGNGTKVKIPSEIKLPLGKKSIGVLPGLLIGRYTLSVSCFPAHVLEWRAFDKTSFWAVLAENKREDP